MDKSIIRDFAKLRVLTPCDFQRMDELVTDLTNALEESSSLIASCKQRKRRGRKRRAPKLGVPLAHCSVAPPDPCLLPSDDSISSADETKTTMDPADLAIQSDSDGISSNGHLAIMNYVQNLPHLPIVNFVESDSVNENFSPVRPHRRRRKFKRMAVDPTSSVTGDVSSLGQYPRKPHRRKEKKGMLLKPCGEMEGVCRMHDAELVMSPVFPGKRKHSMRERSVELLEGDSIASPGQGGRHHGCLGLSGHLSLSKNEFCNDSSNKPGSPMGLLMDTGEENIYTMIDSSNSSLSSSESDAGIYTNDEGREADDEQSDFYHEVGPACGVPGVIPWWEDGKLNNCEDASDPIVDATFQSILSGSFQHMPYESQQAFRARVCQLTSMPGREIRAGRRRLRDRRPGFSIVSTMNEKISKFLQDPEQSELRLYHMRKTEMDQLSHLASLYSLNVHSEGSKNNKCPVLTKTRNTISVDKVGVNNLWNWTTVSDIKRRRKTPPASPQIEAGRIGEQADPIPENNIGNRMLRNMGWEPGTGLGLDPNGIRVPIVARMRPKYQGFGFDNNPIMNLN